MTLKIYASIIHNHIEEFILKDNRIDILKNQPIPKAVTKLAIPAIAGMLVMAIYNAVDAMFVSWVGTEAAGAIQVAFPMMMVMTALSMLFAIGSSTYISRLLGQEEVERANKVTSTVFVIVVFISILAMILGYIFLDSVIRFFGASEAVVPYAKKYLIFILAGAVFQMSNMTLSNMLRSEGSAMLSMVGLSVGAILNIILDPIFIFWLDLGISGAAIATSISAVVSFAVLISPYLKAKSILHIKLKFFAPDLLMMKEVFKIGTPSLFRQLLASFAVGILNQMATQYGGDPALAGMGLMSRVFSVALFTVFGFAQGFQPVAGYNFGAKRFDRLKEAVRFTIIATTAITTVAGIAFFALPNQIMSVFKADPEVVAVAVKAFKYMAITMPFLGFAITMNFLFQAMGRGIPAALLSLSRQGIFFFPLVYTLPRFLGLNGVLITQPAADIFTLLLTVVLAIKIIREVNVMEKNMPSFIEASNEVK